MELYEMLSMYTPYNEQEEADRNTILEYIKYLPDLYDRNCIGHITCSPWIINKDNTKVLMVYHNIYDSWGWCGGHSDSEFDLLKTAIKEGKEETGINNLQAVTKKLFSIEVLPVPAHYKNGTFISSHMHLNFTFLCIGDEKESIQCKPDENSGVKWINIEEIESYVKEEAMIPVYHKLVEKSMKYYK